jgi:hypothetical protein
MMEKNVFIAYPDQNPRQQKSSEGAKQPLTKSRPETVGKVNEASKWPKTEIIRTTLDLPKDMHKFLKRMLLEEDTSIKNYIINLIEADLESRGISY